MRVIKFRGKAKHDGNRVSKGGWVYGCLIYNLDPHKEEDIICEAWIRIPLRNLTQPIEVDANTIGQFTGLPDKNGNEIYEGGILCVSHMEFSHFEDSGIPDSLNEIFIDIKGEVTFTKGQFEVGGHSLGEIPLSAIESMNTEVTGNIHENPELL